MKKLSNMDKQLETVSLDTMIDKHIGKLGTDKREVFESELRIELLGYAIKQARQERNLTQGQLGELVGVQKAQISRLESNASNATMDTLLRVFTALKAKVKLQVELPNLNISIGK